MFAVKPRSAAAQPLTAGMWRGAWPRKPRGSSHAARSRGCAGLGSLSSRERAPCGPAPIEFRLSPCGQPPRVARRVWSCCLVAGTSGWLTNCTIPSKRSLNRFRSRARSGVDLEALLVCLKPSLSRWPLVRICQSRAAVSRTCENGSLWRPCRVETKWLALMPSKPRTSWLARVSHRPASAPGLGGRVRPRLAVQSVRLVIQCRGGGKSRA
jgi:hypothetical protein